MDIHFKLILVGSQLGFASLFNPRDSIVVLKVLNGQLTNVRQFLLPFHAANTVLALLGRHLDVQ